MIPKHKTG